MKAALILATLAMAADAQTPRVTLECSGDFPTMIAVYPSREVTRLAMDDLIASCVRLRDERRVPFDQSAPKPPQRSV